MTRTYNRSTIYSFFDLTPMEQNEILNLYHNNIMSAEQDSYVRCDKDILPLSMFIRCQNSIWSGHYGTSYFSGYFIKINKYGDEALIADRYF